jgi:SAM-dependent methyltransferase
MRLGRALALSYLRLNRLIWRHFPAGVQAGHLMTTYGHFLHRLVLVHSPRATGTVTFFFRNRPQLELISKLAMQGRADSEPLKIAVLACSQGAEAYSIACSVRSRCPKAKIQITCSDILEEVLKFAQRAAYPAETTRLQDTRIFERMTDREVQALCDFQGKYARVRPEFQEGMIWRVADAGDPGVLNLLGPHDIVVANNFLCHMAPPEAERVLRNVARLVTPSGYLVVSGVDLDVRTAVARDLGLKPVTELIEEIHNADPSLTREWPWKYWSLEPLDKTRGDWMLRYASVFQMPECSTPASRTAGRMLDVSRLATGSMN